MVLLLETIENLQTSFINWHYTDTKPKLSSGQVRMAGRKEYWLFGRLGQGDHKLKARLRNF